MCEPPRTRPATSRRRRTAGHGEGRDRAGRQPVLQRHDGVGAGVLRGFHTTTPPSADEAVTGVWPAPGPGPLEGRACRSAAGRHARGHPGHHGHRRAGAGDQAIVGAFLRLPPELATSPPEPGGGGRRRRRNDSDQGRAPLGRVWRPLGAPRRGKRQSRPLARPRGYQWLRDYLDRGLRSLHARGGDMGGPPLSLPTCGVKLRDRRGEGEGVASSTRPSRGEGIGELLAARGWMRPAALLRRASKAGTREGGPSMTRGQRPGPRPTPRRERSRRAQGGRGILAAAGRAWWRSAGTSRWRRSEFGPRPASSAQDLPALDGTSAVLWPCRPGDRRLTRMPAILAGPRPGGRPWRSLRGETWDRAGRTHVMRVIPPSRQPAAGRQSPAAPQAGLYIE